MNLQLDANKFNNIHTAVDYFDHEILEFIIKELKENLHHENIERFFEIKTYWEQNFLQYAITKNKSLLLQEYPKKDTRKWFTNTEILEIKSKGQIL